MAGLRVFVSSTCYDYALLRSELRNFIVSMGYEPIMSDYADVLYDPRIHTHTSCIDEVSNCDMLIVVIGSRFGGKSVPEAIKKIDFSTINLSSNVKSVISSEQPISITQLEVLKAIECDVPIYTFIEKKVYFEHEVYEKNKSDQAILNKIIFPAIDKPETVQYIFGFIDFIRLRSVGNSIFQFERVNEIEDTLRKQWSGYFQRLLFEERHRLTERKRLEALDEKFEDLKTAILSSIENVNQRETAQGVVRYRRLSDLLFGLHLPIDALARETCSFRDLLHRAGISEIVNARELNLDAIRGINPRMTFLIQDSQSFYDTRYSMYDLDDDWNSFVGVSQSSKTIILEALFEIYHPSAMFRHHSESFGDFLDRHTMRIGYADASDE